MHVFCSPHAAVSYLQVEKGSWCSKHEHAARANVFVCVTATISVTEWHGDVTDTFLVRPGESHEVPSKIMHQFSVIESGELIEIYYADRGGVVQQNDIIRYTIGGRSDGNDFDGRSGCATTDCDSLEEGEH